MAIELTETLLSPTEASRHTPGRPHVSTIWRWMTRGCRGIRLESLVCAGRRFTSIEAIARFAVATTAAADGTPAPVRTPARRERDIAEAEKELRGEFKPTKNRKMHGGCGP
jgi:hypothetical protein